MTTVTEECEFIYDTNNKCIYGVKLEYEEIKIQDKYQTRIYLPYLINSTLIKNCNSDEKCKIRAFSVLNSSLKSKYNTIKLRAYNNYKRYEAFKEIVKCCKLTEVECKIAYSNGLYHQDKIGDQLTIEIWKELNKKYKKITKYSEIADDFSFDLSWEKFVEMMVLDNCAYCGVAIKNINQLSENNQLFTKRARGYSMEIDQKDAFDNYKDDNCVACCYWCNNAKTDEFSVKDFKEIAKGINYVWKSRGAKIIDFDKIEFWKK
jgi:hypothetical protein